jgi:hypothetical protein
VHSPRTSCWQKDEVIEAVQHALPASTLLLRHPAPAKSPLLII